ncbi:MAG: hypothetical protein QOI88_1450 [Gammaproteobacteria bacterium]|jgi:hypothetical protein|nr:hypothetical protein [Gammaproteobacteria bacterium]
MVMTIVGIMVDGSYEVVPVESAHSEHKTKDFGPRFPLSPQRYHRFQRLFRSPGRNSHSAISARPLEMTLETLETLETATTR